MTGPDAELPRLPEYLASGPVFESRPMGVRPRFRPGAYGVVYSEDRRNVLLVRGWEGLFLPGGGIDPGETVEQTLHREMREETGWSIRVLAKLGSASEFTHETRRNERLEKHGHFFLCALIERVGPRIEPDEIPRWVPVDEAVNALHHMSHSWAVGRGLV